MQKVLFRADADYGIGYGHFIRTLALADMLKDDFDCTFYTSQPNDYQIGEMQKVCPYVALREESKFEDFLSQLEGSEIVVLDNYFYSTDYQREIKQKGCKLVCVDDVHDKHYVADAVINHAPGATASQYSCEDYTKLYLGPEYLLLRKEFRAATHSYTSFKEKKNIYVCYGGSDELNLTQKACEIILNHTPRHINVVVGGGYTFYDQLVEFAKGKDISIYRNSSPGHMVSLLQEARLAVVPDSMVFFEACCLRRPTISGYDCDNQVFISQYNQEHHLACEIGDLREDFKEKFTKAYIGLTEEQTEMYVKNQEEIIKDSAFKLTEVFNSLV